MPVESLANPDFLFVVGVGRSGTTLMQVFLAAHPNISFLPEINLVRRYLLNGKLSEIHQTNGKQEVLRLLQEDAKSSRLPYSWKQIIDDVDSEIDFGDSVFNQLAKTHASDSTSFVGYKDARLIEDVNAILERWPGSKFVHIFRDPRDVLASRKKSDWSSDYPVWRNIIAGMIQLQIIEDSLNSHVGNSIHEVKYEDLLSRPDEIAKQLCRFLNLEYSDKMLNFSDQASDLVFADEMQWKKNLFLPLMKGNTGKWKKELAPHEIALVERSCKNELQKRGYENSNAFRSLGFFQKLRTRIQLAWLMIVKAAFLAKRRFLR